VNKKIRIQQQYNLDDYQYIYAYGNSEEDLEMLSLADYPYMMGTENPLPAIIEIKKRA
jgi:hydroxymethylpyrimidine pyrophosphatase-like HAD family hydrolase